MNAKPKAHAHLWLVDTHVHLYDCFEPAEFFDAAWLNFSAAARRLGYSDNFSGILLFTECRIDHAFAQLRELVTRGTDTKGPYHGDWCFSAIPGDQQSLLARRDQATLWIVAGRQIITAEKLEVLALITDIHFDDGQPLEECLATVIARDAIPVIPWGAGKWWGSRGRLLSQTLQTGIPTPLYLGDNGGRPGLWRRPRHFTEARQRGVMILPGSDPLPLPWDARRVGSRGLALTADGAPTAPGQQLREQLRQSALQYRAFGGPLASSQFFINQMALRLRRQTSAKRLVDS